MENISLLYPGEEYKKDEKLNFSQEMLASLELDYILNFKGFDITGYFTANLETIKYRQGVFSDLLENERLCSLLTRITPILGDIVELRRLSTDSQSSDTYLYSITEIELYISAVELLHDELLPIKEGLKSTAFIELANRIEELSESEYYKDLNARMKELTSRVREIKSVTIGVNLDARLRPESAGVLSVNNERFKSGDLIQKIIRLDFKNDEYTCIASLIPFKKGQNDNQQLALENAFNNALNDVYKGSMRSWKKAINEYVLENADFLIKLAPEIEFCVRATELIKTLINTGNSICYPNIYPSSEMVFCATGIYNPVVASKLNQRMVLNDFSFDENAGFYVLSGPNRGGKSVITCAIGLTFVLAQLGLPVPADKVDISPVDGIFTHFPTDAEDTIDKGRLGEECARLDEIFDFVTENSLVLLDESLSSTGSYEASYIASEVLSAISMIGCRGIFSTHLHELSSMLDSINNSCVPNGGKRIDTLVAGMEDGERSFIIYRKKPDGKSYAKDIADKYGISLNKILEKNRKNN